MSYGKIVECGLDRLIPNVIRVVLDAGLRAVELQRSAHKGFRPKSKGQILRAKKKPP
jgi:hypothetical protein